MGGACPAVGKRRVWSRDTISAINNADEALCVMLGLDLNSRRNEIILDANVAEGGTHWEKKYFATMASMSHRIASFLKKCNKRKMKAASKAK